MAVKNKAKDRDSRGKIKRKYTGPESGFWLRQTPSWHVTLFMTRPDRRLAKRLCADIQQGLDSDDMTFPLGNHKPHYYYW
ncbi:hypothetical protein [Endozoicomonas lisbonensis]